MNEPIQYSDLNIHRRINAKANALCFYVNQRSGKGLLHRVSRFDPGLYTPESPVYAIRFKTNEREP